MKTYYRLRPKVSIDARISADNLQVNFPVNRALIERIAVWVHFVPNSNHTIPSRDLKLRGRLRGWRTIQGSHTTYVQDFTHCAYNSCTYVCTIVPMGIVVTRIHVGKLWCTSSQNTNCSRRSADSWFTDARPAKLRVFVGWPSRLMDGRSCVMHMNKLCVFGSHAARLRVMLARNYRSVGLGLGFHAGSRGVWIKLIKPQMLWSLYHK